jgi:hypothetical protein
VAVGDVNGDGYADVITGTGPGGGPHVKVFDGRTGETLRSFFAFVPGFTGGVFVAAGDVNRDGRADIVVGAGGSAPQVKVFDARTGDTRRSFFAYDPAFAGGVRVAAGDVNGDGRADIITAAGPGGAPHVKVFNGRTGGTLQSFFAYAPAFTGGVYVGAGDIDADGYADLVTGAGTAPHVKVFSGHDESLLRSFFAYDPAFRGGARVAVGDVNRDGLGDVVTSSGPGSPGHIMAFDAVDNSPVRSFFAYAPPFSGGAFVGATLPPGAVPGRNPLGRDSRGNPIVPLNCPATVRHACNGAVAIYFGTPAQFQARKTAAAAWRKRRKAVLLGRKKFKVRAGHRRKLRVRLSKRGRRALRHRKRPRVTLVVRTRYRGNVKTTVRRVRLRRRKRNH